MKFLERDLEEIIMSVGCEELCDRGLHIGGKKKNQVRIGNYGIADIITFEKPNYASFYGKLSLLDSPVIQVIELKKDAVSVSSFIQAVGYMKGVQRYMETIKKIDIEDYRWEIVLVGKTIDSASNLVYLPDLLDLEKNNIGVSMYTYDYAFDGIKFKRYYGYQLINEGFNHE